jgi:antitoxin component of RelBE/YafQ-DinJ toxin-antitoxin module
MANKEQNYQKTTIRLPDELRERADELAEDLDMSLSEVFRLGILLSEEIVTHLREKDTQSKYRLRNALTTSKSVEIDLNATDFEGCVFR